MFLNAILKFHPWLLRLTSELGVPYLNTSLKIKKKKKLWFTFSKATGKSDEFKSPLKVLPFLVCTYINLYN